jgi:hypothetical protein
MALRDLEAFLRQRAAVFDPNLDTNPGSPFDTSVIQPLLRRIGPDPFSVDMTTFLAERLRQAYPDMALGDGDAITDLLVKPATLLWDPIVREVARIKRGQSFRDPNSLTEDDAEALAANLFAERAKGSLARGTARLYFAQAQNVSLSPVNFVTSRSGLHFFPTETQGIRVEEMLQNVDDNNLFYFDVTVVAENPGADYNIGPDELVSIANVDSAVQVKNIRKFDSGDDAATAAEFIDKTRQELTERSLVTIRGIAAKVTASFPEVTRLNVVGFNDPEMQRDVLTGGGLGPALVAGTQGATISDLVGSTFTRRFQVSDTVDFTVTVGPTGVDPEGFVLEVFGAFGPSTPVRELAVTRVVSSTTLEVETQEMIHGLTNLRWSVRRRVLTLSGIPGGILFPDGPLGTVDVESDRVHIGGCTDVYVRGQSFDEASLVIDNLTDDAPELSGLAAEFDSVDDTAVTLGELVLGTDYVIGDATYELLSRAGRDALSLQVLEGPNAALYRILSVDQSGASPVLTVTPVVGTPGAAAARWRLFDAIDVALYDVKETRVSGDDLITAQNSNVVSTASGVDFDALGVAGGDVVRVLEGPDAGDYRVTEAPLAPGFTQLRVDATFKSSQSALSYTVFRANEAGDVVMPLVRIRSVELLDSSSQPLGTLVPYARPVDVQSRAFQNSARGIKHDVTDAILGIVSQAATTFAVGGLQLLLQHVGGTLTVNFSVGPNLSLSTVIAEINAAAEVISEAQVALQVGSDRFGIRPFGQGGVVTATGSAAALVALFGNNDVRSTRDIRSATIDQWASAEPAIDLETGLDVVQLLDGHQVGPVPGPYVLGTPRALRVEETRVFSPEAGVHLQVGARSIGSARVFFLDPTSFEVRSGETFFELETGSGTLRFTPDPTLSSQRIPAPPGGDKPMDGESADGGSVFESVSQDFILSAIQPGDELVIDYHPIAGDQALSDPMPNVAGTTLIFSVDGSPDKTLTFLRDDVTLEPDEVTRQGIVDQINAAAGVDIAQITSSNTLEFEADAAIVIRGTGTANAVILDGLDGTALSFVGFDQRNTAPHAGTYVIASVDQDELGIEGSFSVTGGPYTSPYTRQQFKVYRTGVQRISTSAMAKNTAEAGLYYFDVELVSEGTGDQYNIDASEQLTVSGYRSDGYYLTTEDENLTFSVLERPRMVISKTVLEDGVDDDPVNARTLTGENILITYDRSSLVEDVHNFISSETERVTNNSPLGRHLIPHFVRFDLTYTGGSKEDVVVPDVEDYLIKLAPVEAFESSDIQKIVSDRGATSIENPIDLIALVHGVDRSIQVARSQNRLTTGRLAAFIPDVLNIKRNIT